MLTDLFEALRGVARGTPDAGDVAVLLGHTRIELVIGDACDAHADAVVADQASVRDNRTVPEALKRGGSAVYEDLVRVLKRRAVPPGEAFATVAGRLDARMVVHGCTPEWKGGAADEEQVLGRLWTRCLEVAAEHGARTLSTPALGGGLHGFPIERAARIGMDSISAYVADNKRPFERIRIALIDAVERRAWSEVLSPPA
jgi:O-acetyl-ADP-ribose deacetylase (regulator of RNase III)